MKSVQAHEIVGLALQKKIVLTMRTTGTNVDFGCFKMAILLKVIIT